VTPTELDAAASDYYESLEPLYDELKEWVKTRPRPSRSLRRLADRISLVVVLTAVATVIPLIPLALNYFMPAAVFLGVQFGGASVGGFVALWIALTAVLLPAAVAVFLLDEKFPEKQPEPPYKLSPEQLSFVSAFLAHRELRYFFANHLDRHVDQA
jgi:hypothetical protein